MNLRYIAGDRRWNLKTKLAHVYEQSEFIYSAGLLAAGHLQICSYVCFPLFQLTACRMLAVGDFVFDGAVSRMLLFVYSSVFSLHYTVTNLFVGCLVL